MNKEQYKIKYPGERVMRIWRISKFGSGLPSGAVGMGSSGIGKGMDADTRLISTQPVSSVNSV